MPVVSVMRMQHYRAWLIKQAATSRDDVVKGSQIIPSHRDRSVPNAGLKTPGVKQVGGLTPYSLQSHMPLKHMAATGTPWKNEAVKYTSS